VNFSDPARVREGGLDDRWKDYHVTDTAKPRRPDVDEIDLVGGSEKRELEVLGYDDRWPDIFTEHRDRLAEALRGEPVDIEHIGSTSVPGLAAKPVIDIVVAVDDITAEEDYLPPVIAAGYVLRVREPGHRMVRTPARDVHVHIFEKGNPAVSKYLLFRDRLRVDADDRAVYARTKEALIRQGFDDMNAYSDAKTEVIAGIMARALAARTRGA
jgi:GrpB-like predicted nucleotidyltransferase (UPF0157 family)